MKLNELSWRKIESQCRKLVKQIEEANFKPEIIISVGRGGMIPSRIISDMISLNTICMIYTKLYVGINKRNDKPTISSFHHFIHGKNVLIVDDIIDSGLTIEAVIEELQTKKPNALKTACLLCKDHVVRRPSFYAEECKQNHWIGPVNQNGMWTGT